MDVQRVRDASKKKEVVMRSYREYQNPRIIDDQISKKVMFGLSQRRHEDVAMKISVTFGIAPSSVSCRFIQTSAKKLEELMTRDLSSHDIVAIVMGGKYFAKADMIVAVGVTMEGEKIMLGFVVAGTENQKVVENFLRELMERGLNADKEIMFVLDGSKGLRKGVTNVLKECGVMHRCQWHKTENVVSYLPKKHQNEFWRKLCRAYAGEDYDQARKRLELVMKELKLLNQHAAKSLEEGLEETLTLHRLGLNVELGTSFRTTNMIKLAFSHVGQFKHRVDCWKNSSQRQRWMAGSLLEIERRLNRVQGHKSLPLFRQAMECRFLQTQKLAA